jgi:hypothetical protein
LGERSGEPDEYLHGEKSYITDERTKDREDISLLDGILRIRQSLNQPGACVRLIGLSGVGKTRLVKALFEDSIGEDSLDTSIAIYTDYSDNIEPTARDMARQLVGAGGSAFLVVDNCNPTTHSELAKICSAVNSRVSLLTVEYDVRDDEPEHTDVFRIQSISPDLIVKWLEKKFQSISQVDRSTIAEFSDGNFRVAQALAETLKKGETLGSLKSRDLFTRIFDQRIGASANLLQAAEDLSLFYSYDGEDTSADSELAIIAKVRNVTAQELFAASVELKRRWIAQKRGRWRAILPHAIANRLAALAIERISASDFDAFCNLLKPRMLRSISRRLGYLHDSPTAQITVSRWLDDGGRLAILTSLDDDEIAILRNLAPVAPRVLLTKIKNAVSSASSNSVIDVAAKNRIDLIRLTRSLAYDPTMFDEAALTLVSFLCAEPADNNQASAKQSFTELFHLYLSGTRAPIDQRIAMARRLARSPNEKECQCGLLALGALLEAAHFSSSNSFDFGARPRDYGWDPQTYGDIYDWFSKGIKLAIELGDIPQVREIFATNVRALWSLTGCQNEVEVAATAFSGGGVWIDGWLNFRAANRFDGNGMSPEIRAQLERIIDQLKPVDLLDRARALILGGSNHIYDIEDGEVDDESARDFAAVYRRVSEAAIKIGEAISEVPDALAALLPEVFATLQAPRAYEFGLGLAKGAANLENMWSSLVTVYNAVGPERKNFSALTGFLNEAKQRNISFITSTLDAVVNEPTLAVLLPHFQGSVGIDASGVARLRLAIAKDASPSSAFRSLASGFIEDVSPADIKLLLIDIANLIGGVAIALEILHTYFFLKSKDLDSALLDLVELGRSLLLGLELSRTARFRDSQLELVISKCLAGPTAEAAARQFCKNIRASLDCGSASANDMSLLLNGVFLAQPIIALDELFLDPADSGQGSTPSRWFNKRLPIKKVEPAILIGWADQDADVRYKLLSQTLSMFTKQEGTTQLFLSPLFMALLEKAPDKLAFLGNYTYRFRPRGGWYGSLAGVLQERRDVVRPLRKHPNILVRQWVARMDGPLAELIELEQQKERRHEESFE